MRFTSVLGSGLRATVLFLGVAVSSVPAFAVSFNVLARDHSTALTNNDISPAAAALNTGLTFTTGDALIVNVSGLWNGGTGPVDANGTTIFGNAPITGINYFSLIGKIGATAAYDASWFKIGTGINTIASSSGTLFLAFLDSDAANNSGFVTANVSAVPEPAQLALLLPGLAAMGLAVRRRSRPAA